MSQPTNTGFSNGRGLLAEAFEHIALQLITLHASGHITQHTTWQIVRMLDSVRTRMRRRLRECHDDQAIGEHLHPAVLEFLRQVRDDRESDGIETGGPSSGQ